MPSFENQSERKLKDQSYRQEYGVGFGNNFDSRCMTSSTVGLCFTCLFF